MTPPPLLTVARTLNAYVEARAWTTWSPMNRDTISTARKRLQVVLDQLNPAGGIVDSGDGSGRHANKEKKKKKKKAKNGTLPNSQNANEADH